MTHELSGVPIISLWQPWAQWVSLGWKTIETRTHNRFAGLSGKRIGIQASLRWDHAAFHLSRPFLSDDQMERTLGLSRAGGAVICTAFVEESRRLSVEDEARSLIECRSVNRFGLILRDIQPIEAFPCKGKQGIFYL